jgi:osmotically-inducible protein OsmY
MAGGFAFAAFAIFVVVTVSWTAAWCWLPALSRRGGVRPAGVGFHRGRGPRGYYRSDERIFEDVSDALTVAGAVDASDVVVETHAGEVALHGSVPSERQKLVASEIAGSVPGVGGVRNQLRVESAHESR